MYFWSLLSGPLLCENINLLFFSATSVSLLSPLMDDHSPPVPFPVVPPSISHVDNPPPVTF